MKILGFPQTGFAAKMGRMVIRVEIMARVLAPLLLASVGAAQELPQAPGRVWQPRARLTLPRPGTAPPLPQLPEGGPLPLAALIDLAESRNPVTAAAWQQARQAAAQKGVAEASLYPLLTSFVLGQTLKGQQSRNAVLTLEPLTNQRVARTANIETAAYNLGQCVVQAPFDARVINLTLSQGAFARPGTQVFTLINTRAWWVVANLRETQLPYVQPGMHVSVFLLQERRRLFRGVVDSAATA